MHIHAHKDKHVCTRLGQERKTHDHYTGMYICTCTCTLHLNGIVRVYIYMYSVYKYMYLLFKRTIKAYYTLTLT